MNTKKIKWETPKVIETSKVIETPKVIWQTWKSKNIPKKYLPFVEKWKNLHPDYNYILIDDSDIQDIVKTYTPEFLNLFNSFTHPIEKVDFARYVILYIFGGIYADLDTYPLKNLGIWVQTNKIVFGTEPEEHSIPLYGKKLFLCNALMISPPRQKWWYDFMLFLLCNYEYNYKPVQTTGPGILTKYYETYPERWKNILITNPCIFYPLTAINKANPFQKIIKNCDLSSSYVVHVWDNTWVNKNWWKDPILFNKRYWRYGIMLILLISLIFCLYRNNILKFLIIYK